MNISSSFHIAVKSILNNKMRSFLTMLGIIIGVCAVIILVTLVQGLQGQMKDMYEKMGTNKISIGYWDYRMDLTQEIYDFCTKRTDLFVGVTPEVATGSKVKYQQKSIDTNVNFGSDQYDKCNNYEITQGRMIAYADILYRYNAAVIGSRVADQLFNYVDPVGKTIKIQGKEFIVVGTFKSKYDSAQYSGDDIVLIPYTMQRQMLKTSKINQFSARAVSAEKAVEATNELNSFLGSKLKQQWSYNVYNQQQMIDQNNESSRMISLILGGIAGISLIVGGIGIMNIMLVSVTERTREIGIRKAIGADRRSIISQFLIEAATLSALGGVVGIAVGILGSIVLGKLIFQLFIYPTPLIMGGAFLFSVGLGVVFGLYPAAKASKLHPIDALRAE